LAIPGANAYYYDHNDRLVGVEYGQGVSIGYIYDGNGNMVHQACLDRSYESNGLPVLWRFLNGLSPTNNSGSNAIYADADGDGWSNYAMWLLGLAPLNSNTMPTNLPNSNPVAVVLPGTNVLGSQATVSIVISNNLGNPSVPFLQFSNATTHGWSNATLMQVDGGSYSTNTRVAAWPSGSVHALVWNASCDLGPVHTGVWLRAQAKDVAFTGAWSDPVVYQVNTLPPPQFDSGAADLQVTPSGFHFLISNVDTTRPLVILASTNLSNWDAIFTISSPTNGTLQFLDTNAPYLTWRFYKATNR
jgi:YD repeat-containing protein